MKEEGNRGRKYNKRPKATARLGEDQHGIAVMRSRAMFRSHLSYLLPVGLGQSCLTSLSLAFPFYKLI